MALVDSRQPFGYGVVFIAPNFDEHLYLLERWIYLYFSSIDDRCISSMSNPADRQ
jgi:hypothetical protein